jgi:hypothetical protein
MASMKPSPQVLLRDAVTIFDRTIEGIARTSTPKEIRRALQAPHLGEISMNLGLFPLIRGK